MKNRVRNAALAVGLAALLWPAVRAEALAVCASGNLADISDPGCVNIRRCQEHILAAAGNYVTAWQTNQQLMVARSLRGNLHAQQQYVCRGGPHACRACTGNNGGCTTGSKIGAACNDTSDCAGGTCSFGVANGCNSTSQATLTGTLDQFECQPRTEGSPFGNAITTAKNDLATMITLWCNNPANPAHVVDPADLGLDRIPSCLVGECVGGAEVGELCNTANPGGQCQGGGGCDVGDFTKVYSRVAECITKASEGYIDGAKMVDTIIRPLAKVTGTGKVPALARPPAIGGPADSFPRQVLQMAGSNILQIGSGVPGNDVNNQTAGGEVTTLSFARCVGGNGNPSCIDNAHCGGGTCVRNSAGGGANDFTAAKFVHKCCSTGAAANVGDSCATDADCGNTVGACGVNSNCLGNLLAVTEIRSNGVNACLVTHTRNSGNGTAADGTINLTTGDYSATVPIVTDFFLAICPRCVAALCDSGANTGGACCGPEGETNQACLPAGIPLLSIANRLDLTTGRVSMKANFAVSGGGTCGFCDVGSSDGVCDKPPCDSCGTAQGVNRPFCVPLPLPLAICCGGRTCDTSLGVSPKVFCGFCDTDAPDGICDGGAGDALCAVGCTGQNSACTAAGVPFTCCTGAGTGTCDTQSGANQDCAAKTNITTGTSGDGCTAIGTPYSCCLGLGTGTCPQCDTTKSAPGFHGDCSISTIEVQGEVHEFTPIVVGLSCTGVTGVNGPPDVDHKASLPGPVRISQPYIRAYVTSTDP